MTAPEEESITELLDASSDDLATLRFPVSDRAFGFHAQQATEKLLKALITARSEEYDFTHDLEKLVDQRADLKEQVSVPEHLLSSLTLHAGRFRYTKPDPFAEPERLQIIRMIEALSATVLARIGVLLPTFVWPTV